MSTPDPTLLRRLAGRFVVFDGPDGSGKTTQFRRFVSDAEAAGVSVCEVREPGGTEVGEQIRQLLLDPSNKEEIDIYCEMLLFMASRAQLVSQRIRPALAAKQLVLADRFISSTLAYQGAAGGIEVAEILRVGQIALRDCWPHLVVIFDVDERTAAARMNPLLRGQEFGGDLDRMELKGAGFHRIVRRGYQEQAEADPNRHLLIDATAEEDAVYQRLLGGVAAWLDASS